MYDLSNKMTGNFLYSSTQNDSENFIVCTHCKERRHISKYDFNYGKMYCDDCRKELDVKNTLKKKKHYEPEDRRPWMNGDSELYC
jgi:hypothetical protein